MSLLHPFRQIEVPSPEVYGYVPKTTLNPISRSLAPDTFKQYRFSIDSDRNFDQAARQAEMPEDLINMSAIVLSHTNSDVVLEHNPEVHQPDFTEFDLYFRFGAQPSDDPEKWQRYPDIDYLSDMGAVVFGTQLELLVGKAERDKKLGYVAVKDRSTISRLAVTRKGLPILKIRKDTLVRVVPNLVQPYNLMFGFRITRPRSPEIRVL